jgi:hypothetical protein
MNQRLAEFLMSLVRDPEKLEAFNSDDDSRRSMIADADLSQEEKDALLANDSAEILRLLQATDEDGLTWLGVPGIKDGEPPRVKFTVGFAIFGIKGGTTAAGTTSTRSTTRRPGKKTAKKTAKKGGTSGSTAKAARSSKSAKASKASKTRGTKRKR